MENHSGKASRLELRMRSFRFISLTHEGSYKEKLNKCIQKKKKKSSMELSVIYEISFLMEIFKFIFTIFFVGCPARKGYDVMMRNKLYGKSLGVRSRSAL